MLVDGYEILVMLYLYQIAGFGCIGTQNDRSVQGCQYAFSRIGGYIRSEVPLFGIVKEMKSCRGGAVEYQSVYFGREAMLVRLYFSVSSYCLRNSASRCVRSISESSRTVVRESMEWMVSVLILPRKMS